MKKISIICCFLLITVFSAGSYLIHKCYLHSYKKEFKSFLFQNHPATTLSVILVNPSELYSNSANIMWEDNNKEVLYKGVLYDIVRIENRGLQVALLAVSDEQEMSLKKQFSELYELNLNGSTKHPYHLLKNFFNLKYIVAQIALSAPMHFLNSCSPAIDHSFMISPVFISLETPPPDLSV